MVGDRSHPTVRYSSHAVFYEGQIIITHGYFYNHDISKPAWQSDAWAYTARSGMWRQVHRGEKDGAPSARYSGTAVLHKGGLYMYGGDDGGHKRSMNNYVFKAWNSELWRLDLGSYAWRSVTPAGGPSTLPPKRALHSAVVLGDAMYVYGGIDHSDTWSFDFATRSWRAIEKGSASKERRYHPGVRHSHSAAADPRGGGFFVFGGSAHGAPLKPLAFDDLWRFDLARASWTLLEAAPSSGLPPQPWGLAPPPRSHSSLVAAPNSSLLLYGGALCTPGCRCYGDAWVYHIGGEGRAPGWSRVNTSSSPIHRYRQSLVRDPADGSLYLFGGESYKPYMYHNAVDRLWVEGLSAGSLAAPSTGPRLGATPAAGSMVPVAAAGVGIGLLAFWLIRKTCCAPREKVRFYNLAPGV